MTYRLKSLKFKSTTFHFKQLTFASRTRREIFLCKQKQHNVLADPHAQAKPKSKPSDLTQHSECWLEVPLQHHSPLTAPLSQTGVQPVNPESQACVRADVRIPPTASQMCLRYRDNPALSYGLLHPPSECVC